MFRGFLETSPTLLGAFLVGREVQDQTKDDLLDDPCKGFPTWKIIPVSKWLVTPIYKPFRPFIRGPTTLLGGLTITMVISHLRPSWDDPPSTTNGQSLVFGLPGWVVCYLVRCFEWNSSLEPINPGSPKTKLCPLVVGNPLHGSS